MSLGESQEFKQACTGYDGSGMLSHIRNKVGADPILKSHNKRPTIKTNTIMSQSYIISNSPALSHEIAG